VAHEALVVGPAIGTAIMIIMVSERKWRQPGFAPHDPVLIGRHELIGRVQRAKMHLDFVGITREYRGAAPRAEVPTGIFASLSLDAYRFLGENCGCEKERAMVLAAIQAMADAGPVRRPRHRDPDITAQASAIDLGHLCQSRPSLALRASIRFDASALVRSSDGSASWASSLSVVR